MTLSEYLAAEGISASEFAKRTGINKGTVSRWLAGLRAPDSGSAAKVLGATGGKVDLLASVRRPQQQMPAPSPQPERAA